MGAGILNESRRPGLSGTLRGLDRDTCGWSAEYPEFRFCSIEVGSKLFEDRWEDWQHAIDSEMDFDYYIEGRNALGTVVSRTLLSTVLLVPSEISIYVDGAEEVVERERAGLLGLDNGIVGEIVTFQRAHLGPGFEDGVGFQLGDNYWDQEGDRTDDVFLSGALPGTLEGDSAYVRDGDYTCGADDIVFSLTWGDGDDWGRVTTVGVGYGDPECKGTLTVEEEAWSRGFDDWGQPWEIMTIKIDGSGMMQGPPGSGWDLVDVVIEAKMVLPRRDPWVAAPGETIAEFLSAQDPTGSGGG
jgi:hypothetical protein